MWKLLGTGALPCATFRHTTVQWICKYTPVKNDVSFSLREGFPLVLVVLLVTTLKGDYAVMAELLHDNIEAECGCGTSSGCSRGEVPDLFSCIKCFGMYAAVVTS